MSKFVPIVLEVKLDQFISHYLSLQPHQALSLGVVIDYENALVKSAFNAASESEK